MSTRMPPVPPDNQSPKGTGDSKQTSAKQTPRGQQRTENPDQQGDQGNIKQNTTNQGYQQDR
ncbi:hypothetical protein ACVIW2_002185 [Bradyrhizobium huanghuaihaiense]|uniref:Uncharacterized protein n=1 Tax=Bradyrhizobium huanghuaihaiense TaxID=990078 RepID=A0A562RUL3_9BRAD|nr:MULTISPECIES: hypothetical protein [Bradyrhizobium]MBR0706860.1 hypothetical protein [Bradyrhizobium liaoningense]TWI72046.1 hypothetical protein IQ16_02721 [Bradyrhizobium huanghuaihaiense]UWU73721.1 hypothetical protein N2603_26995 [Bradyrhizobium sp. CB3035]